MRPKTFDEFTGQEAAVGQIRLALDSAKARQDVIDHVLLTGPPGLGKTTIANLIANALGTRCIETIANSIRSPADMTTSLVSLRRGEVLFIDEIHALPTTVQEYLYTAMEDYKISMISKAARRSAITINLNKFVLVGATTIEGQLSGPMLDRFGIVCRLQPYTDDEIKSILINAAMKDCVTITPRALDIIANRCRATPRIALRHLRRARDSAVIAGNSRTIDSEAVEHAYSVLRIREHGLTDQDVLMLKVLSYSNSPIGLNALASHLNTTVETIETVIEPHLLRIGAVERTPRGRTLGPLGMKVVAELEVP